MPAEVTLRRVSRHALADLATGWRDLEASAEPSPFQRWSWVGCLASERYDDPVLLQATLGGRIVGLALCNRRVSRLSGTRLFLHETGDPARDGVYIEHNAPLVARGHEALLAPMLGALMRAKLDDTHAGGGGRRGLVLSGAPAALVRIAQGLAGTRCVTWRERPSPFADLARPDAGGLAASLGRSTRQRLARSRRAYAAHGQLELLRACDTDEALGFLDQLVLLHQHSWKARGQPGAFADPAIRRFHAEIIRRGLPRGEVELLRVSAGPKPLGYLYNLVAGARMYNYQSGFAYAEGERNESPGLTCHECAADDFRARGGQVYDFLAGEDRYKQNLSHAHATLCWAEAAPAASQPGLALAARAALQHARGAIRNKTDRIALLRRSRVV